MLQKERMILKDYIKADALFHKLEQITKFHRIQGSPMFRKSAQYCAQYLTLHGIDTHIKSYLATAHHYAGPYKLFQEWNCQEAYLTLCDESQTRLADYKVQPMSIIQKSIGCDYRTTPIDVLEMNHGSDEKKYQDIDFKGKLLFIKEDFHEYEWAIEKGAIGFISDFLREVEQVRTRQDLYESLNYTSFWWKDNDEEKQVFGFVLSPKEGDKLRAKCKKQRQLYKNQEASTPYLQVNAYIDASLYDGHIDIVEAVLPGKSKESILMIAHLCHPCASANDNASGVSGAMESLCAIKQAINDGLLPPLDNTITLLLVPEFSGTYCYLDEVLAKKQFIGGINIDMIGAKQDETNGPITITNLPFALPSFEDFYAHLLMHHIIADDKQQNGTFQSVKYTHVPFALGSDHSVLCDPLVNIPCIMLGQWPDKYYHTSSDTIDRIDTNVLTFSTLFVASYVYGLANQNSLDQKELNAYCLNQYRKALDTANQHEYELVHTHYQQILDKLKIPFKTIEQLKNMYPFSLSIYHNKRIPIRTYTLPICDIMDVIIHNATLVKQYQAYQKLHPCMQEQYALGQAICDYYIDGKRCVEEIVKYVLFEQPSLKEESILAYLNFLEISQLIHYK